MNEHVGRQEPKDSDLLQKRSMIFCGTKDQIFPGKKYCKNAV
jgi:hypothetical protein